MNDETLPLRGPPPPPGRELVRVPRNPRVRRRLFTDEEDAAVLEPLRDIVRRRDGPDPVDPRFENASPGWKKVPPSQILDDACPICLDPLDQGIDSVVALQPCKHQFHRGCLRGVAKRGECPMCRQEAAFQRRTALMRRARTRLGRISTANAS